MDGLAIRCRGLVKRYPPDVLAVDGLDLEVRRGECFGLLGPNGAGKTTTIEILEGLLAPSAGDVELLGTTWARDPERLRQRLGITLQETHLPERLTVEEILRMFRSFYERGREVEDVIALVALGEKRRAWFDKLSGGQKQRLAVACALVGDPELLFLDEPTTGLDPQSRRQLWDVVLGMKAEGRTVLLTTHYMDEAEALCDRLAIMDHGQVIATGTPAALIAQLAIPSVVELTFDGTAPDPAPFAARLGQAVEARGDLWEIPTRDPKTLLPLILETAEAAAVPYQQVHVRRATLEDVFLHQTGRSLRD